MALKRTKPELDICGVDINSRTIQVGIETKSIDWGTKSLEEGVKDADLIIIATLVSSICPVVSEIIPYLKEGCIITDVGSIKEQICTTLEKALPPNVYYVGGHPMAGSEAKGIAGADSYLFENAVYILTPTSQTNQNALNMVQELIEATGARIIYLSPPEHDLMVAGISHLPHVLAAALVNSIGLLENEKPGILKLAAGGFRDVTRIADSQPEMWQDIFLENRNAVLETIKVFKQALEDIEQAISNEEKRKIYDFLTEAQTRRRKIPGKVKGLLPELYEIVVTVPDKPGIIGKLANLLGNKNINIMDIEIIRVREGDGGTIRFGFQTAELATRAVEVFRQNGYIAKERK